MKTFIKLLFFILITPAFAININIQNNSVLNGQASAQAQFGFGYTRDSKHYYFPRAEVDFPVLQNYAQTITQIQSFSVMPPDATQFFLTFMYFNIYDKNKKYLGVTTCPIPLDYITKNITYIISSDPHAFYKLKCNLRS